jgi:hypothetical protein
LRRTFGYVLVSVGLLLLFMAPLARWYVLPRVKKLPTDYYYRAVSDGTGSYLSPTAGFQVIGPVKLQDVHIVRGDVEASSKEVAVWDSFDSTFDVENGHQLSVSVDRYTFDRVTALSVDCCDQNQDRTGSLTLLFPIGAAKHSYPFWDETADQAFPMDYQDTETLAGLTVYHYHQHGGPLIINHLKLPGKLVGTADSQVDLDWWYTVDTDVWVEPLTGAIIKGSQSADQWLALRGERKLTIATTDFTQSDNTVQGIADFVKPQREQLVFVQYYLPLIGPVAGIVLLVVGMILLARGRRPADSNEATAFDRARPERAES